MTETSTTFRLSASSGASSQFGKYGNLIQYSAIKVLQKSLSNTITYVFSESHEYKAVHSIVALFRILQIIGPCLCPWYSHFWGDSIDFKAIGALSIFWRILPNFSNIHAAFNLLEAYIALSIAFFLILFLSANYYRKNSMLPFSVSQLISLYIITAGYLLHPMGMTFIGTAIASEIFNGSVVSNAEDVVIGVALLCTVCYYFLFWDNLRITITFRPDSLMTLMPNPMVAVFFLPAILGFINDFGSQLNWNGKAGIQLVNSVIYFASCLIPFYEGGFVRPVVSKLLFSAGISGGIVSIYHAILFLIGQTTSLVSLFILILFFIISMLFSHIMFNRIAIKHIIILDQMENSEDSYVYVKTPNHFMNLMAEGYKNIHPYCINGKLHDVGATKWESNMKIWFIVAKFFIIFPDEELKVGWVFNKVKMLKFRGSLVRSLKTQIFHIIRTREMNLSQDLKPKLDSIGRKISSSKQKLRHVWDLVLQGNVKDMETSIKRSYNAIQAVDQQFSYLFRLFPNNRFVTRQYARFALDIKGDRVTYNAMFEKTRQLQRGVMVSTDLTHEYGVSAFGKLTEVVMRKSSMNRISTGNESISETLIEIDIETEDETKMVSFSQMQAQINDMKIPVIRGTIQLRLILLIIFFYVPSIAFLIYNRFFVDSVVEPLSFIYNIVRIRTLLYQLTSFSLYYIYENIHVVPYALTPNVTLEYFGNTFNTREQLSYIASVAQYDIQNLIQFQVYKTNYPNLIIAQKLLFSKSLNFTSFVTPTNYTIENWNVQNLILDYVIQSNALSSLDPSNVTIDILNNNSIGLNIINNYYQFGRTLTYVMDLFNNFLFNQDARNTKTIRSIEIGAIVFSAVLHIVLMIIQLAWIQKTKSRSYESLTALPKNIISTITDNLRAIKNNNNSDAISTESRDTDMNRQEDNILKILMAGSSSSAVNVVDNLAISLGCLLILTFTLISFTNLSNDALYAVKRMHQLAPHLNYIGKSYTMCLSVLISTFSISCLDAGYQIVGPSMEDFLKMLSNDFETLTDSYTTMRFGSEDLKGVPFEGFAEIKRATVAKMSCADKYSVPATLYAAISCYEPSDFINVLQPIIMAAIAPWKDALDHGNHYSMNDGTYDVFSTMWSIMIHPMFDLFFKNLVQYVIPTITSEQQEQLNNTIPVMLILLACSIVVEIFILAQLKSIEKHIKYVLSLFLMCPSDAVMQISTCRTILSGDFSSPQLVLTQRNDDFFVNLVNYLPYISFWISDESSTIENVNERFVAAFGDDMVGKTISEFFSSNGIKIDAEQSENISGNITIKGMTYNVKSMKLGSKICVAMMDITQRVRYNTLISEERSKSDYLLSSILPKSLVPRVQAGEKSISFAVHSATIVFLDIVSFTPWCGANEATKVMMTLNLLFKKLDSACANYETMTKIKCIGDCYMAAGGVFDEINQPAVHSKEVVSFGLDALDAVGELNEELSESLQIRVGINTGGPIVGGVLGIGKPTFEILGPAINMAQQMEHHGVPMNVHISRSVYELIYGGKFKIKERGTIEIKNAKVSTYLVIGKDD